LRSLRCEYAQGYLFSQPLNVEAITALLSQELEPGQFNILSSPRSSVH